MCHLKRWISKCNNSNLIVVLLISFRLFGDEAVEDDDDDEEDGGDEDDDGNDSGSETSLVNGNTRKSRPVSRGSRTPLPLHHKPGSGSAAKSGVMEQISGAVGGLLGRKRKGSLRGEYNSLGGPNDS